MKAAKEKAIYLSDAIGEKVGVAVTIQEPTDYTVMPVYRNMMASNTMLKEQAFDAAAGEPAVDFKKIKLRYEVSVIFALQ